MSTFTLGKKQEPYNVRHSYILYNNRLCSTHSMHDKVMYESLAPPYAVHRGTKATFKGSKL